MFGFFLAYGDNPQSYVREKIKKLNHDCSDSFSFYDEGKLSCGFTSLSVNDKSAVESQPQKTTNFISFTEGQIYNHSKLKKQFNLDVTGNSNKRVIPYLFEEFKEDIIDYLDGFYSSLLYEIDTRNLYCIRDHMGKNNLLLTKNDDYTIITNEIKSIQKVDEIKMLPKGVSKIDLSKGEIQPIKSHNIGDISKESSLKKILKNAVRKRIPSEKFGVFLSGGLDSSIIAYLVKEYSDDVNYYILGNNESEDLNYALNVADYLELDNVNVINIPDKNEIMDLVDKVIYITESYNPSIISNGICTHLLFREAKKDNLKVVLLGEGADEIFCGYRNFRKKDDWKINRKRLINDMFFTELRRIYLTSRYNCIEPRLPFLDKEVFRFSENLDFFDFFHPQTNKFLGKYVLREEFKNSLPNEIISRSKTSLDVGSGIRRMVVEKLKEHGKSEKKEMFKIWRKHFPGIKDYDKPYFHSYPVFKNAIKNRGVVQK